MSFLFSLNKNYQWLHSLIHGLLLVEVVEHACGMASLQIGEFIPNASNGIDTYCIREPLGVCAGICPFDFPAMISLWVCMSYFPVSHLRIYIFLPSNFRLGSC